MAQTNLRLTLLLFNFSCYSLSITTGKSAVARPAVSFMGIAADAHVDALVTLAVLSTEFSGVCEYMCAPINKC